MLTTHPFSDLLGNETIKSYLQHMIEHDYMGNTLLFAGPEGVGKGRFAWQTAKELLCKHDPSGTQRIQVDAGTHPDLYQYYPEGKLGMHSIDRMRGLSEEVYLAPYSALCKVFIIYDADRMLTYSSNALLKTFEEPAQSSIIFLVSSDPERLLPTIRSRCRTLYFQGIPEEEIAVYLQQQGKSPEEAASLASLSHGSISRALRLAEKGSDPLRRQVLDFLSRGRLAGYHDIARFAKEIGEELEESRKELYQQAKDETMKKLSSYELTAVQKHAIQKEVEGQAALKSVFQTESIFDEIYRWYRDLNLLTVGGEACYLFNADYQTKMIQVLNRGRMPSLSQVAKALSDARLTLRRSTPIATCFETVFLRLGLV